VDPKGPKEAPKEPMVVPRVPQEDEKTVTEWVRLGKDIRILMSLPQGCFSEEQMETFEVNPRIILMDRLNDSLCIAFRRHIWRIVIIYSRLIMCQNTSGTTL
jgi:hypothetical protein